MKYTCNNCDFYVFIFCGLSLVFTYDDLSYKKMASQSSTMPGMHYDASYATDRNTATCMRAQEIGHYSPDITVWWKVDLGEVYNIYSIDIIYKNYIGYENRQQGRFAGFSLYVSNTDVNTTNAIKSSNLCYKDGPQLPPLNFTTTCTEYGRYIIFYNERLRGEIYPTGYELTNVFTELCEVKLNGCNKPNVYGIKCDLPCPITCKHNACHIENGSCFLCMPGWKGTFCALKCEMGWYGYNCSQQCAGHCTDSSTCNHVTGQCDVGCAAGWTGSLCDKECDGGTYGYDCIKNCSGHCLNDSPCNKQTGHCDRGCDPGYTASHCSKRCLLGHFGLNCREFCNGHCLNNEPCDHISGVCPNGCRDGYIGTHCNRPCKAGYYGTNCSLACPANCKTCHHTYGLCTCKAGWMGHNCTKECIKSYGENCNFKCSVQCNNQTCDRFNGSCLFGCKNGEKCETAANLQITETRSDVSPWTVAFSITLVTTMIFISTTLIMLWRFVLKKNSLCDGTQPCWRSTSNQEMAIVTDEASHYQDLNMSKEENTYQTLEHQ